MRFESDNLINRCYGGCDTCPIAAQCIENIYEEEDE